jgi:hypothetical protein
MIHKYGSASQGRKFSLERIKLRVNRGNKTPVIFLIHSLMSGVYITERVKYMLAEDLGRFPSKPCMPVKSGKIAIAIDLTWLTWLTYLACSGFAAVIVVRFKGPQPYTLYPVDDTEGRKQGFYAGL